MVLTQKQKTSLDIYAKIIHELATDQLNGSDISSSRLWKDHSSIFARMFGQLLYEGPIIFSGFASIKLIENKLGNFKTKHSVEHYHGRQNGGDMIMELISTSFKNKKSINLAQIHDIVFQHCQVHYTTLQENTMLRQYQRTCSTEAAYRRCNIKLIDARELFTRKGIHTDTWKQQMIDKYTPIIQQFDKSNCVDTIPLDRFVVIN